jgi:hypothetical protein
MRVLHGQSKTNHIFHIIKLETKDICSDNDGADIDLDNPVLAFLSIFISLDISEVTGTFSVSGIVSILFQSGLNIKHNKLESAYHHYSCEFESHSRRGVPDTTLCDKVCQLRKFGGFPWQVQLPLSIILTAMI